VSAAAWPPSNLSFTAHKNSAKRAPRYNKSCENIQERALEASRILAVREASCSPTSTIVLENFSPAGGWCWPLPSGGDSSDADAQEDRTRAPGVRTRRVTEYASLSRLDWCFGFLQPGPPVLEFNISLYVAI
jgi:hypothetical protein